MKETHISTLQQETPSCAIQQSIHSCITQQEAYARNRSTYLDTLLRRGLIEPLKFETVENIHKITT